MGRYAIGKLMPRGEKAGGICVPASIQAGAGLFLTALAALAPASAETARPAQLDRASLAAAAIDQQLRNETDIKLSPLEDPALKRVGAGIAAAAVPRWTGTPQITESPTPDSGDRLYKISYGTSTYCARIPSPRIGIDRYERLRANNPSIKCPR